MKQLNLLKLPKNAKFFGGSLLIGRRKSQRPLDSNQAVHIVVKSQWAHGKNSFLNRDNYLPIKGLVDTISKKYGVRIYQIAIVSNHIHMILRTKRRWLYRAFISSLTGQIAQHVMKNQSFKNFAASCAGEGVKKYEKQQKEQNFWLHRPFTRILTWGRNFNICMNYLTQNTLEALGFVEYKQRRDYYSQWKLNLSPPLKV